MIPNKYIHAQINISKFRFTPADTNKYMQIQSQEMGIPLKVRIAQQLLDGVLVHWLPTCRQRIKTIRRLSVVTVLLVFVSAKDCAQLKGEL